ncbi:MAG: S-adenosylmethionine:tRNA ribosyltransferase-isomerase, partial [Aldersonia sp.]|nr:S-adenosylmethionine:tRNA ribosyltransferase-isomerase [Aldersonia sp.]
MTVIVDQRNAAIDFVLPPDREAAAPPEARGLERDEVRLLVSDAGTVEHSVFRDLPRFLRPGDLLVVNDSATMSAAVDGRLDDDPVVLHVATWLDDGRWVVEVRSTDGKPGPWATLHRGSAVDLPGGVAARLTQPWLPPAERLWTAQISGTADVRSWLARYGRPITYAYVRERWPARYYRTAFGRRLGSAEMPSAARPFTDRLVTDLVVAGVGLAPITLHTGVSSP